MIERVLIAEDHESASISLQKSLADLRVATVDHVFYCDDALAKIITAKKKGHTYDLLITDLYFEEDGQPQDLRDGAALIRSARSVQPDLKILVFSAENKTAVIDGLYNQEGIDGYVRKARNDTQELKQALEQLEANRKYRPRHLHRLIDKKNFYEFSAFDIEIISLLASGVPQKDIPVYLEQKKIRPSGLSSIEKRLNHIRTELSFTKNEQLVAFCKDLGII